MRNFDTVVFATNYVNQHFPQGTSCAIYGCSQNEAFTWGVLFHPVNKDKRYKIMGYDIVPEVIEDAKLGVLNLSSCDKNEWFLIPNNYYTITPEQERVKTLFLDCFDKLPKEWRNFNIFHPRYKQKAAKLTPPKQDANLTLRRLEYMHIPGRREESYGVDFIPKSGIFDGIINFKVADIFEINQELQPESVGMVSFKNGLYHLLDSRKSHYENIDLSFAENLFRKINSVMQENGILVLGSLAQDHLYTNAMDNNCVSLFQKGKSIKVCKTSPIHKALIRSGFEPIFYEILETSNPRVIKPNYLPTVWKKIRPVLI